MDYIREMRASCPGFLALALALAVPLSAIWAVPWFVTQDGPAHVYNAQILAESFDPESPSRLVYTIAWKPIPNWAGHLILAGLVTQFPAWIADRIMTSITLVGLAAATLWLRWRVAGAKGLVLAALLSALLAMNMAWLLGFTSFLIGSCLVPDHARRLVEGPLPAVLGPHCGAGGSALRRILLPSGQPGADRGGIGRSGGDGPGAGGCEQPWRYRIARLAAHIDQLHAAPRARLLLFASGQAQRADAAGMGKPVECMVAERGLRWLGRSDHTRDEGRIAVHEPGQPRLRRLFRPCLADGGPGALVVRANDRAEKPPGRRHPADDPAARAPIKPPEITQTTARAGCFWRLCFWSEESSDQIPSAPPTENSSLSGCCSWASSHWCRFLTPT